MGNILQQDFGLQCQTTLHFKTCQFRFVVNVLVVTGINQSKLLVLGLGLELVKNYISFYTSGVRIKSRYVRNKKSKIFDFVT